MAHVFITGDVHGGDSADKLEDDAFTYLLWEKNLEFSEITRNDYVIILGDFMQSPFRGDFSCDEWLDWCDRRPWTTLFVDGNHEDFDMLDGTPATTWNGGRVHILREHVIHLMRSQIFDVQGHTFLTLGGAYNEIPGPATTPARLPRTVASLEERSAADALVARTGNVDYVLTHAAPTSALRHVPLERKKHPDEWTDWLQEHIANNLQFKQWFFGHYHVDTDARERFVATMDQLVVV